MNTSKCAVFELVETLESMAARIVVRGCQKKALADCKACKQTQHSTIKCQFDNFLLVLVAVPGDLGVKK